MVLDGFELEVEKLWGANARLSPHVLERNSSSSDSWKFTAFGISWL